MLERSLPWDVDRQRAKRLIEGEIRQQDGRCLCRVVSNVLNQLQEAEQRQSCPGNTSTTSVKRHGLVVSRSPRQTAAGSIVKPVAAGLERLRQWPTMLPNT